MDEYRENVKKVQKALEQDAAFLQPNPYLAQRVLNAARTEGVYGISMKHKMSLSMVLVIVLLSISLVAGAVVVITSFIDHAALLQNQKGDMSHWTLEDKIDLIVSMKESGIDIPQEQLSLLTTGGVSTEEATIIADRLIVEKNMHVKHLQSNTALREQPSHSFQHRSILLRTKMMRQIPTGRCCIRRLSIEIELAAIV